MESANGYSFISKSMITLLHTYLAQSTKQYTPRLYQMHKEASFEIKGNILVVTYNKLHSKMVINLSNSLNEEIGCSSAYNNFKNELSQLWNANHLPMGTD